MDPTKSRKPSLPRLTTNLPAERQSAVSLPVPPKYLDPNVQRPPPGPTFFLDEQKENENIAPCLRYVADAKGQLVQQSTENQPATKMKTSYYEDAFAFRGTHNSPQERVAQDSVVVADLKTNHKIKEGSKFIADFLFRLALIYQRPEASIMIAFQQDTRVVYGSNTTLSAYLLTIYALPSLIAPMTNLRNTSLIQATLQDLLGIPPNLGVVIYIPVPEDNLATNGMTVRDEISRLERNDDDNPGLFKTLSRTMSRRLKSNSAQSAPHSGPSTGGATSPTSNPRTDQPQSPETMQPGWQQSGEEMGQSLQKRDSFRTVVRRRLMDKIKEVENKKGQKDVIPEQ